MGYPKRCGQLQTGDQIMQCYRTPHRIVDRKELMGQITLRKKETITFWYKEGI